MSMRKAAACGAMAWGVLVAGAASAGPVTIDGFATAQELLVNDATPLDADGVPAADAIGGARRATLQRLGGYGTDTLTFNGGGFGRLDLSSAAADSVTAAGRAVSILIRPGSPVVSWRRIPILRAICCGRFRQLLSTGW